MEFCEDAIAEIAEIAYTVNMYAENIGARRLHTILERVLQDLFFNAPETENREIKIDGSFVRNKLAPIYQDRDLSRYIL